MATGLIVFVLCILQASAQTENCGVRPGGTQIVGGEEAAPNSWPWMVSLQFLRNETYWSHTCGVTLFDEKWALTAAHCVSNQTDPRRGDPENFKLILGAHDLNNLNGEEQIMNITKIIAHEYFDADPITGFPNDIALLQLAEKPDTNRSNIAFSCIPYPSNLNFTSQTCYMTGWGIDDNGGPATRLRQGQVTVRTNEDCGLDFPYIRDTHICVGDGTVTACSGDSGGPLNCEKDGKWMVAGVTSFGIAWCADFPSVYTRTSKYWDWIADTIARNEN